MNSKMRPMLTVAVCTRNRAELLKECLDSVVSQIDSAKNVEVLAVDNGSTDGTAETCGAFEGHGFPFKYAFEPEPGLSRARNRAIAEANGEAIAFLDDDAVVCDGWLDVALENWKSESTPRSADLTTPGIAMGRRRNGSTTSGNRTCRVGQTVRWKGISSREAATA